MNLAPLTTAARACAWIYNRRAMFNGAIKFNSDVSKWDTSQVKDMPYVPAPTLAPVVRLFADRCYLCSDGASCRVLVHTEAPVQEKAEGRTLNLAPLTTAARTCAWIYDLRYMFECAVEFNSDVSKWVTSQVISMKYVPAPTLAPCVLLFGDRCYLC